MPSSRPSPSVSVAMPVYQGERFLAETITSILDQSYRDFEVVLLDNACTDRTVEIARSFDDDRIRIEHNDTLLSQPDNWSRVIELCRAPLVKLLCADDLLHPRCLELQAEPMFANPGIALVAARQHLIDEQSRLLAPRRGLTHAMIGVHTGPSIVRSVVRSGANPIGGPNAVMFRRADFHAVGGWRAARRVVMDCDLWVRLLDRGNFLGLKETLSAFRIRRGSVSADNSREIYEQQLQLSDDAARNGVPVSELDRALGKLRAPAGHVRRMTLFALSRVAASVER